jgi:CheY-like chemotaxis protein
LPVDNTQVPAAVIPAAPEPAPASTAPARSVPILTDSADPASEDTPSIRFHGEKILIVDDDLRNVFALTAMLEQHGLDVVYADNGVAGVRALEQYKDIALVLMDVMMPELDGNATIAAIREMSSHADLPVIAVTAKAMQEDRDRTLAAGANDYVTKPVNNSQLLRLVAAHLDAEETAI